MADIDSIPAQGKLGKAKAFIQVATAACVFIGTIWVGIRAFAVEVGNVTTDEELIQHNSDEKSHPHIIQEINRIDDEKEKILKEIHEEHEAGIMLAARYVSLIAADREPKHELKAAAATYYREEFIRHIRKENISIEDAMLETLRQPWYDKPRIR